MTEPLIRLKGVWTQFGTKVIHRDLDLDVCEGEVLALVGGSGSGKTTLMRHMIGLTEPSRGTVEVLGETLRASKFMQQRHLRQRWGVLFQFGALFSSLSVLENISLPLVERGGLSAARVRDIALLKLCQTGLQIADADKMPAELSGGMVKRVALARALVLDPLLLFLDEPTSGLDPVSADEFVQLVLDMRQLHGLTAVMITHDLARMKLLIDRVAVLADQQIIGIGTPAEVSRIKHPYIESYFSAEFGLDKEPSDNGK